LPDDASELLGKMRLVGHPATQRDFTQWCTSQHERLRHSDAPVHDVLSCPLAKAFYK
jgi:hypothetical protein